VARIARSASDATADSCPVFGGDQVKKPIVRRFRYFLRHGRGYVEFLAEEFAEVLAEPSRILADDLKVHDRLRHSTSLAWHPALRPTHSAILPSAGSFTLAGKARFSIAKRPADAVGDLSLTRRSPQQDRLVGFKSVAAMGTAHPWLPLPAGWRAWGGHSRSATGSSGKSSHVPLWRSGIRGHRCGQ
jgi:hypothetical protein